jgi:hypothetical protein
MGLAEIGSAADRATGVIRVSGMKIAWECARAATANRRGNRDRARPGCGGISSDPFATVGSGRVPARTLTTATTAISRGFSAVLVRRQVSGSPRKNLSGDAGDSYGSQTI